MIRFPAGFDNEIRIKRYLDYYQAGYGVNAVTSSPAWTPLNLFANGETGGWWDFTDLSTLSQDNAGTTPVTAATQSIGLVLDKSKGLALGSELFPGGTPSIAASGTGDIPSWSGSAMVNTGVGTLTFYPVFYWNIPSLVTGKWYRVTISVTGGTSLAGCALGLFANPVATAAGGTTVNATIQATSGGTSLWVHTDGRNTFNMTPTISVRELAGNSASQSTALVRPVLGQDTLSKYYAQFNGSSTFLEALYSQTAYPMTLVAAMNNTITSGNGVGIASLSQGDVQYKVINELAASGTSVTDRNSTSFATSTVSQTGNKVVFADFSAAAVSMTVNKLTAVSTANSNAFGSTTKVFLGKSRPAGLFSNGRLYSALAINRSLTPTEMSFLRVYLGSTMGVAL